MKKILLSVAAFFLFFTLSSFAQTSSKNFKVQPNGHAFLSDMSAPSSVSTESKAYKNFRRAYPGISNEKWRQEDGHYFVSFSDNNVKYKVVYAHDGRENYTLKIGDETLLPKDVRASIKSVYYDYSITNVQELDLSMQTIYIAKINNGNTWKTVKVNNGEIEEIENFYSVISPCR